MKKRYSFLIGAGILAVGGLLAKIIGALYKIPLTHILGSNGMGVYYLIFPIYSLLLIVSSSGISIGVSRLVAVERARRHKKNEMRIFVCGVLISFVFSAIFSVLIVLFGQEIAFFQGNSNAYLGYVAIAPALICSSIIAVIRSYFQGIENMVPTSASIIFEQIIKLFFGLFLSFRFLALGVEYAVLGAILGVTISELCSMILLCGNFVYYKNRYDYKFFFKEEVLKKTSIMLLVKGIKKSGSLYKSVNLTNLQKNRAFATMDDTNYLTRRQTIKKIFALALPSMLSSIIIPITALLDSFLVINLLTFSGIASVAATSLYGISNGIIASLIGLPIVLISSLSTALLPNLSSSIEDGNPSNISIKIHFYIKLTWIVALPLFVLFLVLAPEIISFLISGGLTERFFSEFDFAYKLLMVASVSIIYYAFLHTFIAILQAINKPLVPFFALLIGVVVRTALTILLVSVKSINVFGVVIANVAFLSVASFICAYYINKQFSLCFNVKKMLIFPLFSSLSMGTFVFLFKFVLYEYLPLWIYLGICGAAGIVMYFALIYVFKVFSARELEMFPKIKGLFNKKHKKKV